MKLLLSLAVVILFAGCSSTPKPMEHKPTNLTFGAVKSQIKEGVTTQPEVIRLLGSPNMVSKNSQGFEVWTYSKTATQSESKNMGIGGGVGAAAGAFLGGLVGSASKAVDTTSVKTFDLVISFDNNDVVKETNVVTSEF